MSNVEIELNSAGIQALLKSDEIASVCESQAARMTRATGVKYVPDVHVGKTRVNAKGVASGKSGIVNAKGVTSGKSGIIAESAGRAGREVKGYYRKGKNGKMIYVKAYRRTK